MSKPCKIGPWGGNGGSERDVHPKPRRLVSVTITSGVVIGAISFIYEGSDNKQYSSGKWGGTGGTKDKISLDPSNHVTEISGTTGTYGTNHTVTSLTIVTFKGDTKTYGTANGTPFRIPVLEGRIVGFFGRSGSFLDAIGIYVAP